MRILIIMLTLIALTSCKTLPKAIEQYDNILRQSGLAEHLGLRSVSAPPRMFIDPSVSLNVQQALFSVVGKLNKEMDSRHHIRFVPSESTATIVVVVGEITACPKYMAACADIKLDSTAFSVNSATIVVASDAAVNTQAGYEYALAHELLHTLGFIGHVSIEESIMTPIRDIRGLKRFVLPEVDKAALRYLYK